MTPVGSSSYSQWRIGPRGADDRNNNNNGRELPQTPKAQSIHITRRLEKEKKRRESKSGLTEIGDGQGEKRQKGERN